MRCKHDFNVRNFFIGQETRRKHHTSLFVNNHNGVMKYGESTYFQQKTLEQEQNIVAEHLAQGSSMGVSKILSCPKVNACSAIIIKNRNSGSFFTLHHTPEDLESSEAYNDFFSNISPNSSIDIVVCAGSLSERFFTRCQKENIRVSSYRIIPTKDFFDLQPFVLRGEPDSLHISYNAEDDRLVIFGDKATSSHQASAYISDNIFTNPDKQIVMHQIKKVQNMSSDIKSLTYQQFQKQYSLLCNSFIKQASNGAYDNSNMLVEYYNPAEKQHQPICSSDLLPKREARKFVDRLLQDVNTQSTTYNYSTL